MTNKVSIIIPVFNSQEYISRCLDSLINQSYNNIEIICVNDGSTDSSLEILSKYSTLDSRVKIYNQSNQGPAKARNIGLLNSRGEYIMFCDSDDWYSPNMCEKMILTIINKKVDLAICHPSFHFEKDANGKTINRDLKNHSPKHLGFLKLNDTNRLEIFVTLWNKIFKKSIIDKYNITFPNGYEFDDDSFVYQYLQSINSVFTIKDELYNYFIRPGSIMTSLDHSKRIGHINGSLSHTILSLKNNNFLNDGKFIEDICFRKLNWTRSFLKKSEQDILYRQFKSEVLKHLSSNIISDNLFFDLFSKGKYEEAFAHKNRTSHIKKFKIIGITIFKKKKSRIKVNYYFLGIQVFKKKITDTHRCFFIFGIPIINQKISL